MTIAPNQPVNPLNAARQRTRVLWIVAVPVLMAAGVWALRPLQAEPVVIASIEQPIPAEPPRDGDDPHAIDPNVFAVNLWNAPPSPARAEQTAVAAALPPPPPLNVQLIGIITEAGEDGVAIRKAALYDPQRDRLVIVAHGERLGEHLVRIDERNRVVEFTHTAGSPPQRLLLRPDKEAAPSS